MEDNVVSMPSWVPYLGYVSSTLIGTYFLIRKIGHFVSYSARNAATFFGLLTLPVGFAAIVGNSVSEHRLKILKGYESIQASIETGAWRAVEVGSYAIPILLAVTTIVFLCRLSECNGNRWPVSQDMEDLKAINRSVVSLEDFAINCPRFDTVMEYREAVKSRLPSTEVLNRFRSRLPAESQKVVATAEGTKEVADSRTPH